MYRKEINTLFFAIREHIPKEIDSQRGLPYNLLRTKMKEQLCESYGIQEYVSYWAIDTWAYALGLISKVEADRYEEKPNSNVK